MTVVFHFLQLLLQAIPCMHEGLSCGSSFRYFRPHLCISQLLELLLCVWSQGRMLAKRSVGIHQRNMISDIIGN